MLQLANTLYSKGIDSRQLVFLKLGFVKKDKEGLGRMKLTEFRGIMNSILKSLKGDMEIFDLIINFIKDEKKEDEVLYDKLNTLIEVFQFYPLMVRKDKNQSTSIYYIMSGNKSPGHKVPITVEGSFNLEKFGEASKQRQVPRTYGQLTGVHLA